MRIKNQFISVFGLSMVILAAIYLIPPTIMAHCDTMDGPVVKAAQKALDTGDVNLVLIWVQPADEAQLKEAFNKTLAVRKLSPEAKGLADMYFFETLVRVHRAGEGAPYTGLKPAGTEVDPGIEAADKAVEKGSADELLKHLTESIRVGVTKHFEQVNSKKSFNKDDIAAGREFVESYVIFIHYVEALLQAAEKPVKGHYPEAEEVGKHEGH